MSPDGSAASEEASFLFGTNGHFIAELYSRFLANRASVDGSWAEFFDALGDSDRALLSELRGASWAPSTAKVIGAVDAAAAPAKGKAGPAPTTAQLRQATLDSIRALMLIRSYR